MKSLGTLRHVARYPVKSMRGEELRSAPVGLQGLPGDRDALVGRPKPASALAVETVSPDIPQLVSRLNDRVAALAEDLGKALGRIEKLEHPEKAKAPRPKRSA